MSVVLDTDTPFPGMRPYGRADADWFFGRREQAYALYRLVDRGRFIAVVGGSGSGKSSIVRAGLLQLLDKETSDAGGRNWQWWTARPGHSPLDRLAAALAAQPNEAEEPAKPPSQKQIERNRTILASSSFGLCDILGSLGNGQAHTPLLLIDQFEELFRFAELPGSSTRRALRREEAAHFAQLLIEASRDPALSCRIVITMRSDYLGDCSGFAGLPEAVTTSQFLVPGMNRRQLEETIRGPVEKAGAEIQSRLVQRLLEDASAEIDQLPVLAHCMMRVWQKWRGSGVDPSTATKISNDIYEAVGALNGALSQHAEEIIAEPEMASRLSVVEGVFRALSELDRGRGVRRPLPFDRLVKEIGEARSEVKFVVDRLRVSTCAFLLPPRQELSEATVIDIAHEALIRHWSRISVHDRDRSVDPEKPEEGWLWQEAKDGERYRALVTLLEDDAGRNRWTLPMSQVQMRLDWWRSRPRTAEWAERYVNEVGGRIDEMERMFERSCAEFERAKRRREADERNRVEKERAKHANLELAECAEQLVIWDLFTAAHLILACTPGTNEEPRSLDFDISALADKAGVTQDVTRQLLFKTCCQNRLFHIGSTAIRFPSEIMLQEARLWAESYIAARPFGCFVDLRTREVMDFYGSGYAIGRRFQTNLADITVSRAHMIVFRDWVENLTEASELRSLNGTTVNAKPLLYGEDQPLKTGDVVVIAYIAPFVFISFEDFFRLAGLDQRTDGLTPFGVPRTADVRNPTGYMISPGGLTTIHPGDVVEIGGNGDPITAAQGKNPKNVALTLSASEGKTIAAEVGPGPLEVEIIFKDREDYRVAPLNAGETFILSAEIDDKNPQPGWQRDAIMRISQSFFQVVVLPDE